MKNKALIIILLTSFMIPLGAVNLAVANDKSTSMNGIEIQANHFEALNHKTTNSVATSYQKKKALRPIKRKFRFRRNALRCPGF